MSKLGLPFARLRTQNGRHLFTLKRPIDNEMACLEFETEVADPEAIDMLVRVNGELRAASNTARLQSTVAESIAYATSWLELGAGDVIMTGAPATFVPVEPGDLIELDFPGIGTLSNPVIEERS